MPEQPHLDATLTVRELIAFQAAFYPRWDHARAEELIQRFVDATLKGWAQYLEGGPATEEAYGWHLYPNPTGSLFSLIFDGAVVYSRTE